MNEYVVTFFTHLSALRTQKALGGQGLSPRLAPVPRRLSSSCGTCVYFSSDQEHKDCLDEDFEGLYLIDGENYRLLYSQE